jgi:hypothetical protein
MANAVEVIEAQVGVELAFEIAVGLRAPGVDAGVT